MECCIVFSTPIQKHFVSISIALSFSLTSTHRLSIYQLEEQPAHPWIAMSSSFGQSTLPAMPSASLSPPPSEARAANGNGHNSEAGPSRAPLSASASASASASPQPASPQRPYKKHNLTPAEIQARALERLLADPNKPVPIPKAPKTEKTLRPPREMMKNVSGSSAGAGSGDFHVYKHARRREYERVKLMEEAAAREARTREFEERHAQLQSEASSKTSKNRAKRDKKKMARMAAKEDKKGGSDAATEAADTGGAVADDKHDEVGASKKKRINAQGTAQVVFARPASSDDSDNAASD